MKPSWAMVAILPNLRWSSWNEEDGVRILSTALSVSQKFFFFFFLGADFFPPLVQTQHRGGVALLFYFLLSSSEVRIVISATCLSSK
jgi:hypothetical protein